MEVGIHKARTVQIAEYNAGTGPGDDAQAGHGDPANDWVCAWCWWRVASKKDRFEHQGQREFFFRNPAGHWRRGDLVDSAPWIDGAPNFAG